MKFQTPVTPVTDKCGIQMAREGKGSSYLVSSNYYFCAYSLGFGWKIIGDAVSQFTFILLILNSE